MKVTSFAAVLALGAASAQTATIEPRLSSSEPFALTKNGTISGTIIESFKQEAFLGIPYAAPAQRLRRPQRLNSTYNDGAYSATIYAPFCPGFGNDNVGYEANEDCLYLNIIRPQGVDSSNQVPAAVWIYGGGYQQGGTADRRYNGSWIVERSVEMGKPIIFASLNYRTAAGGFLSSAEIEAEGSTNNGLYDQRLALEWLQENGGAFGIDTSKVTLMGESAGAFSIGRHLLAFGGKEKSGLFRAAILQSGSPTSENFRDKNQTEALYQSVLQQAGCANATSGLACLRELPFDQFNASVANSTWRPVVDGGFVTGSPTAQLLDGEFEQVPLLLGTNADEGTAFGAKGVNTTEQLSIALQTRYPGLTNASVAELLRLYPDEPKDGCPFNTGDGVLPTGLQDKRSNAIFGDFYIVAGRRLLAEQAAKRTKVFSYRFNQVPQNLSITIGSTHFQEVAYVFSNPLPTQNRLGNRPTDLSLAKYMTSSWISFIHDLDPNHSQYPDAPYWPAYGQSKSNMVFERQASYTEADTWREEAIALQNTVAFGQELGH